MDSNSVIINSQTLTSSKQQKNQQQSYTGNTNTHITASINQLRTFSTALSAFIRSYDELNTHIGFINSSIDANLPPNCFVEVGIVNNPRCLGLLDSSCDRTVNDVTEGVVSVRNPRGRVGECEGRRAGARTAANERFSPGFDETDALKKLEVDNTRGRDIDGLNSGYSHGFDELDASKKPEVASNHVEIGSRGRDIGVFENHVEIDSLNSGYSHGYDELDASKKPEVANSRVEIDTRGRDIDVCKNRVEIDSLNSGYDELDASKKPEVANTCVEIDSLNNGFSHGYDELDASKKVEVADQSEEDPEEIDSLKKRKVADNDEEIVTFGRDIDVCKNRVEIDSFNRGFDHGYDELDASKKVEVADELEDPEQIEEEIVTEGSCDETMAAVQEAVDSEDHPNGMVANGEQSNENVRTPEFLEEINVSAPKKIEEIDILNKPEANDICRNAEETVMVKKLEEFDAVLESSCDKKSIAIVSERKHKVMAMKTPVSFEEVDVLKKPAAINIPKKVEVTDICKKSEQIDVLLEPEELDTLMIRKEVGALKKHEDVDISMEPEETDTSKKPEESLPETSCDRTRTSVPEAIASEQNPNQMATDCEQSHENVCTPENLEETAICKNPKETVVLEKSEKTNTSKKRKKIGTCKKAKKPTASKKSVVSNGKQSHEKVTAPEHLQEIDILNNPEQTDICKNPEESTVSKKPEELDIAVISKEVDTSKNHEDSLPKTSCDRTRTTVTEAIESEQTPNTMAANDKPSHEVVMTPECHVETDVSVCKKPEQTVVSKKPEQTDILNRLEETVVSKNLKRINTLKKHEENGTCKRAKETKTHTETTVLEAIVSEQNPNRMAANDKPSHENVTPDCFKETEVSAPKKPEQTVASKKPGQTVSSKKPEQTVASNKPEQTVTSKKPEQAVASKKPEQAVASKKPDQAVASKKPDQAVASKKPEQAVASKKPEQAVASKKPEQAVASKNPDQTVASKKPGQTVASKKPEQTVASKKPEQAVALKKPEQAVTSKKPEQAAASKKPEQAVASKNPDQTVASKNPDQTVASKKPEQTVASKKPEQAGASKKPEQTGVSKKPEQTGILNKPEQTVVSKHVKTITTLTKHEENETCKKAKETEAPKKFVISMLESLCRGMCFKDMKYHVALHYSEMINCREEIAKSLKLAKDPAKLVLYSIGSFFIQDSKTFCNPHQKESQRRMASVLILECFVMISRDDGIEIAKREQQYAAEAAVDRKKRMVREGGLRHADEVDSRGLLLLISGFGIEDHVFKIQDIIDLIRASNVKGIATALRRSAFLIPKVTEVIYSMVNNGLEIEAVDIAYTFGLEHKCHTEKILTAYLQNKIKDFRSAPPLQMLEVTKQHIFDLTLVKQCLESHNVDPSTLLPDFKIKETIQHLEKEINEWKLIHKRKSQENPIHQEAKRACYVHEPVDHYGMDRFNRSTQPSTSYITKHPASPVYDAYARPENRNGSVPNGQAGGYRGSYNQTVHAANNQPHGWHGPYGQHQTYGSQPDHRLWDQKELESFPGFLGSQPPSSDLYSFVKLVEKGLRGSRA